MKGNIYYSTRPTQSVTDDSTPGNSVVSFVIKCVIVELTDNVPLERSKSPEATTSTPSHTFSATFCTLSST